MKLVILQIIKEKQHKPNGTSAAWTKMIDDPDLSNLITPNLQKKLKNYNLNCQHYCFSCFPVSRNVENLSTFIFSSPIHCPPARVTTLMTQIPMVVGLAPTTGGIQHSSSTEGTLCSLVSFMY